MLARANRVTEGADYRRVSRGPRSGTRGLVVHGLLRDDATAPTRFGFIITKRVGVAVVRNRLRRRCKAICRELLMVLPTGLDLVIRLHPEAAELDYAELRRKVRRQALALAERLGATAIPETCSCGDEVA